jgi:predicted permease
MTMAIIAFFLGCVLIIYYEIFAWKQNTGKTISEIIWRITVFHPIIAFLFGILMGHFFWQSAKVYLGQCK